MVPALVELAGRWGFAGATRIVAGAALVLLIPLSWVILGRRPPQRVGAGALTSPHRWALLADPRFWRVAAPFALALTAQVGFLNQQLSILAPWLGAGRAAIAVSVTALAAVTGLSTAAGQVTYAFGPALLALIRDTTGSYRPALAACVALEVAAAAMVGTWRGQRRNLPPRGGQPSDMPC